MKLAPLAAALGLLALLPASAPAAGHWSSPVQVAPASGDGLGGAPPPEAFVAPDARSLVVSSDGLRPWLAAGDVTGRFTAPAALGTEQPGTAGVDAALGADGTLAVAWATGGAGHVTIVPPGQGARPQVDLGGTGVNSIAVAVAADGAVTVAYRTKAGGTYGVQAATAPPGGAFGEPQTVLGGSGGIDALDAAAGPGGAVAVAFRRLAPRYRAFVAVRPAAAGAFEAPQAVSAGGDQADSQPQVAFDAGGTVVATWANPAGAGYALRAPGAAAFAAPAPLGPAGELATTMDLVPTPQGGTAATWRAGAQIRAAVRPDGGAFGDAPAVIPAPSPIAPSPAITVAPDGTATVLTHDPADGAILAADLGRAPETVGYGPVERASAVAIASSADRTVAVWRDAQGGVAAATRSERAPASTGPGAAPPAPDRRAPKLTVLTRSKRIAVTRRTRAVTFRVRCDEACTLQALASMRTVRGRRTAVAPLRPFRSTRPSARVQTVRLGLGPSAQADLRRALARRRGANVFIDLTASDAAGNLVRRRLQLTLKPAGRR